MHDINAEEPPIRRLFPKITRTSFKFLGQTLLKPAFWAPTLLVIAGVFGNVSQLKTHAQTISDIVVMDPKTKVSSMAAIDEFTPFIEETRDAEPVVTAEITPSDLILTKPGLSKTSTRPEETPKEPEKRSGAVYHTVAAGETLSGIAKNYGLKTASILVENDTLKDSDALKIGDQLKIPAADYSADYIAKKQKTTAKSIASATSTKRTVAVRETSAARYEDSGMPSFGRPAGSRGQNGYHDWAIDISPAGGTNIVASAEGVVVEVSSGWNGGYGNMVKIDHGSGWETLYAHLESVSVRAGQKVGKGASIGIMGATGRTYPKGAVHLHFEIRKSGNRLNPINYID